VTSGMTTSQMCKQRGGGGERRWVEILSDNFDRHSSPGQRQTVDIMLIPNSDKPFVQKLTFRCKYNTKQFVLSAKGQGVNFQVDPIPETVKLGPVLPYSSSAIPASR
jgi:hypothetical protein